MKVFDILLSIACLVAQVAASHLNLHRFGKLQNGKYSINNEAIVQYTDHFRPSPGALHSSEHH